MGLLCSDWSPQEPPSPGLPPAEAAFDKTVSAALESVTKASETMSTAAELPTLGGDRVRKEGEGRLLGFLLYLEITDSFSIYY